MRKQPHLADLAAEWVKRFPEWPKRTLARKMHADEPDIWDSVERARMALRYTTGAVGPKDYAEKRIRVAKPHGKQSDRLPWPKSVAVRREKHFLPAGKIAVLSDIHLPIQDDAALLTALEYVSDQAPDTILFNGDLWDQDRVSRHAKNPRSLPFQDEREFVEKFLDHLRERFPTENIWYKEGNHEERLAKYIWDHAPEFGNLPELTVEHLLKLHQRNIYYVGCKELIFAGDLVIIHGHEVGGSATVNPARALWMRMKGPAMCGHFHQTDSKTLMVPGGEPVKTFTLGCLCGLTPDYAAYNAWNHGFAMIDLRKDGSYTVQNLRIEKGQVVNH